MGTSYVFNLAIVGGVIVGTVVGVASIVSWKDAWKHAKMILGGVLVLVSIILLSGSVATLVLLLGFQGAEKLLSWLPITPEAIGKIASVTAITLYIGSFFGVFLAVAGFLNRVNRKKSQEGE